MQLAGRAAAGKVDCDLGKPRIRHILGLADAGVETDRGGYVNINRHCQSSQPHIYAAGDVSGKLPLSSVASMQGRKVAEHVMGLQKVAHRHLDYDKAASAIFTEPEIADVGLAALVSDAWWVEPTGVDIEQAKFASPEQAQGLEPTSKSDVYALCLCLLEAVTGHLPFVGDSSVATLSNRVDKLLPVSADLGPLAGLKVDDSNCIADLHAGSDYRAHLAAVMTKRAVQTITG